MNLSNPKLNLAEQFKLFALTVTRPHDEPMGLIPENTRESKHWEQEKQRNDERGVGYRYNDKNY